MKVLETSVKIVVNKIDTIDSLSSQF